MMYNYIFKKRKSNVNVYYKLFKNILIIFVILINGICMIYVYNFLIFSCILESKKYFVCVYEILSFEGLCINSLYLSNFVFVY